MITLHVSKYSVGVPGYGNCVASDTIGLVCYNSFTLFK